MSPFHLITQGYRRVGLMAGVFAFLCQVLAWSVAMPALPLAATADTITICSADGIKLIKIGADGQAIPDDDGVDGKAGASGHCPLCPVVGGAGLPPVPPLVVPSQRVVAHDARGLPGAAIAAGWFLSSLQARAPPRVG